MKYLVKLLVFLGTTLLLSGCGNSGISEPPPPPFEFESQNSNNSINYDENLGDYYFNRKNYELALESYSRAKINKPTQELDLKIQKTKYSLAQKGNKESSETYIKEVLGGCCIGLVLAYMVKEVMKK